MNFSRHCGIVLIIWMLASAGHPLSANVAEVVRPEFLNELRAGDGNPPVGQSTSMTFFGGNIDTVETAPAGTIQDVGPILMVESSFGQALATDIPYPGFTLDAMLMAQTMLYPPAGWTRTDVEGSALVFRYKVLLYEKSSGGVALDPGAIKGYFGDAEREKFVDAVKRMRDALKYAPYDRTLRNTLLDAYYDLAVTEALFAKMDRAEIAEYRLGLRPVDSGVFVIDREISLTTAILTRYETALIRYGELLTDRMGVDVSAYDVSLGNGMPLGAWIFQQEQPARSQYAAQFYDDTDGLLKTVPYYDPDLGQTTTSGEERVLFSGYKDYVNLLGLLREYTVNAAELARLHGMRGQPNDIRAAYELIGRVQRETQLQVLLLRGIFAGYAPPPGDASGLSSALNGLGVGLAELDNTRTFLDGESNVLGFDPNFLVLIKEAPDGTDDRFDSYDALIHWIGAPRNGSPLSPFTPLGAAAKAFDGARTSHDTYKGNADQVWTQLAAITSTYGKRYFEITGWEPGDTTTNHILEPKPGSELWQAHRNVELMNTRVDGIRRQARNLEETVTKAGELLTHATGKSGELDNAKQDYFNETTSTWDELHTWKARMARSQAIYDTVADASGVDGVATAATYGTPVILITATGAANTVVQTMGAKQTSMAEQDLAQAAANYEVAVMKIDIPAEIAQAEIEIQDRLREQISLTLEMQNALAMQTQEIGRRQALIRELERIRQQAGESDAGLADRYFADPVHFLRSQNDMILADQAFHKAQRWVFFTLRALEYKWNKDFVYSCDKNWEISSLFKLRNYAELEQLVAAMEAFNAYNSLGHSPGEEVTLISLRDDVLAPEAGGFDGLWMDVVSSERVPAIELFRSKLHRSLDKDGNLVIPLNTFALKKETGFFFIGPRYSSDGRVVSPGTYLDKIDWIKFNIVGSHAQATRDASLSYGGTCYIRTRMPPCGNLAEPFRLQDEFRAFPFFYFRTMDNGATWETLTAHRATVKVAFTQTPGEPEPDLIYPNSTLKNNFLKERSVAATQWVLILPAGSFNIGRMDDIEIHIRHHYAIREDPTCP